MIKTIIVILILFISFLIITNVVNKNKLFNKIPNKFLYPILFAFVLVSLISFRVINDKESNGNYIPAKLNGKTIIPGKVEYDK